MKDNAVSCQHLWSDDAIYKEVVVIGNGPSGIVTSFMLAGHVPYLRKIPEELPIDEMLKMRLSNIQPGQSLYDIDLMDLAAGLEGRCQNPIPLLLDSLLRPCADLDIDAAPLVEWRFQIDKQIDHVVLGKGGCGGAWRSFPPELRALSPRCWLTLPVPDSLSSLTLTNEADDTQTRPQAQNRTQGHSGPQAQNGVQDRIGRVDRSRPSAGDVVGYCARYVRECGLQRYFVDGVTVTGVTLAAGSRRGAEHPHAPAHRFVVHAVDASGRRIRYHCARVVVACGACDRHNALPVPPQYVLDDQVDLCKALQALKDGRCPAKVLVVGSGLSAADGVVWTRRFGHHAVHAHRTPPTALASLAPSLYPEYCEVYKMMCDGPSAQNDTYTSLLNYEIVEVSLDPEDQNTYSVPGLNQDALRLKKVKLKNYTTDQEVEVTVSMIAVFVGSKPDLQFLQMNFPTESVSCQKCSDLQSNKRQYFLQEQWSYLKSVLESGIKCCKSRYTEINGNTDGGRCSINCEGRDGRKARRFVPPCCCNSNPLSEGIGYGCDPTKPIDPRSNPIAVNKGTHEMVSAPEGAYALGPLCGDNFIRFIPGGALALVAHMHKIRKQNV